MWLLALLLGCPKAPAPAWEEGEGGGEGGPRGPVREPVEGPIPWRGAGLCLTVPAGWSGTSGPAPQLLDLTHQGTGSKLRLQAWPWGTPMPQERAGFELVFAPTIANYRTVPLLAPARTYTLADAAGELVQGWIGTVDGRLVVVEHQAPFGRTTEGRDAMTTLLASLRRCGADAGAPPAGGS